MVDVQIIRGFPVSAAEYIAADYHQQVIRPSRCPNCNVSDALEALGYYERSLTLDRQIVTIHIRRFRCRECSRTVSVLPSFAQPYRLVQNAVIQEYFETEIVEPDSPWKTILATYRRQFTRWLPELRRTLATVPGRAPPFEVGFEAWTALRKAVGDLGRITEFLVAEFRITVFGRYRCHAPSFWN